MTAQTAADRYHALEQDREPFLVRGRECARYTIPSLLVPAGFNGTSDLDTPWQSLGSRCVNNLASALLLALMPPTRKFFRLRLTAKMRAKVPPNAYGEFEQALSRIEQRIMEDLETTGTRVQVFEGLKQLVVSGNVAMYFGPESTRVFPLHQYVARRDPEGNLVELIIKEEALAETLPDGVRVAANANAGVTDDRNKVYDVYTRVFFDGTVWHSYQEVQDVKVPGSEGTWPKAECPFLALRWIRIDGEHYGRGHTEENLGDHKSHEGLTRAIVEIAAVAAKVLFLVNPNGMTDKDDLAQAASGDIRDGTSEDVHVLGLEKFNDFRVAQEVLGTLEQRLSAAYLLSSGLRRDAERVTREEILMLVRELENALGGVYSIFTVEFMRPLVVVKLASLQRQGKLPALPVGSIEPVVVTGVDALGRANENERLDRMLARASELLGPQAVATYIDPSEYLRRASAGEDVEPNGLIRTPEEVAAQQRAMASQELIGKLGGPAIQAASDYVNRTPQ